MFYIVKSLFWTKIHSFFLFNLDTLYIHTYSSPMQWPTKKLNQKYLEKKKSGKFSFDLIWDPDLLSRWYTSPNKIGKCSTLKITASGLFTSRRTLAWNILLISKLLIDLKVELPLFDHYSVSFFFSFSIPTSLETKLKCNFSFFPF